LHRYSLSRSRRRLLGHVLEFPRSLDGLMTFSTALGTVGPSKELGTVGPFKELGTVGPSKELGTVGPSKELGTVAPSKELGSVGPSKELGSVGPSKELGTVGPSMASGGRVKLSKVQWGVACAFSVTMHVCVPCVSTICPAH